MLLSIVKSKAATFYGPPFAITCLCLLIYIFVIENFVFILNIYPFLFVAWKRMRGIWLENSVDSCRKTLKIPFTLDISEAKLVVKKLLYFL